MSQAVTVPEKTMVQVYHYYMDLNYGAFIVRHISENNILVTIIDSFGNVKKASYLMFTNCMEIPKITFDTLYKKHVKNAHLMGNKYGVYQTSDYAY